MKQPGYNNLPLLLDCISGASGLVRNRPDTSIPWLQALYTIANGTGKAKSANAGPAMLAVLGTKTAKSMTRRVSRHRPRMVPGEPGETPDLTRSTACAKGYNVTCTYQEVEPLVYAG